MPIRYDRASIKATKTPEGFVQDSPILSRVGIFEYRQPDGTVRKEYRPPEEVFHADHLASLHLKPITEDHHGMITGTNVRGKLVGSVVSPGRADANNLDLLGDVVVYDSNVLSTKKELSLTYQLRLDETPGENQYGRYDAIQRDLRVNSVALCLRGRAGNARLNLDAADAVSVSTEDDEPMTLVKVRLDSGLEYDASPEVAVALAAASGALKTEKTRADTAEAARDGLQAKVDGHAAAVAAAREDALKTVQIRSKLEADAGALGVTFKQDATDADLRAAVIKHVRGDSLDLTGKSDAYIDVAYDMALVDGKKAKTNASGNRQTALGRQDGAPPEGAKTAADARAAMVAGYTKTKTEA